MLLIVILFTLGTIPLTTVAVDDTASPPPLSEQLTREGFLVHLDEGKERFQVWGGEGLRQVVEFSLISVDDTHLTPQVAQFTIVFRGPEDYPLEKGAYTFENPYSGRFQLFIEAPEQDVNGLLYRVDFNLLRQ